MRPEEIIVPIVDTLLDLAVRTGGQVELTCQPAPIPGVVKSFETRISSFGMVLSVLPASGCALDPLPVRKDARLGSTAGLTKRILETSSLARETGSAESLDMRVTTRAPIVS